MIRVEGAEYGTAAEVAAALGPDVTVAMVRAWARRDGLQRIAASGRGRGEVRYPLLQAAVIEQKKRQSVWGRPRSGSSAGS